MKTNITLFQALKAGLFSGLASGGVNAVLFFAFTASGIVTDQVMIQPGQPLGLAPILISSLIPSLIGAFICFLLEKFSEKGFSIFQILAWVLLVLSFGNPFLFIPQVPFLFAIALNIMHIPVALSLLYFLRKVRA